MLRAMSFDYCSGCFIPMSQMAKKNMYYVGFDVDHTIIKYKNDALGELIFHSCAKFLYEEKGYDRAFLDVPYDAKSGYNRRGLIWDLRSGDILELSQFGKVKDAYHGTKRLSSDEVSAKYGDGVHFAFDLIRSQTPGDYFTLFDFFVNSTSYLIMLLVEHNLCNNGDYRMTLKDLFAAFDYNFAVPHFAISKGYYFPALVKNPDKFIVDRRKDGTVDYLKELRRAPNVQLFLLTNSNYDYARFLLLHAFGKDFLDLFDLVIYKGQKKNGFFTVTDGDEKPFLAYSPPERHAASLKTEQPLGMSLREYGGKEVIDGNLLHLNDYFGITSDADAKALENKVEVIYMGDDWKGDIILPKKYNWKTVAIAEELGDDRKSQFLTGHRAYNDASTLLHDILCTEGDFLFGDVKDFKLDNMA